ncbi:MAG TPA: hypothetical protein VF416_10645 [Marmoricola sp.]
MSTVVQFRPHAPARTTGDSRASRTPWWLALSVPIGLLGIAASLTGILVDRIYRDETSNWANQATGQDFANLGVLAVLLVLGYSASYGSARALLAWAGTVVYTAYTYAIYAFAVHFGPLFLLYVAVLGLSVWALIGFFASIDPARVRAAHADEHLTPFVAVLLIVLASGFALLWLAQDLPAMISGTPSKELRDTGLLTNPVHVLDLALFLPASLVAGITLYRRLRWGHVLAPIVLTAMAGISLGIVSLTVVSLVRDADASGPVAVVIGALGIAQAVTCWQFLRGFAPGLVRDEIMRSRR